MAWTTPRTWVSGETVTAALMNAHVRDNLKAVGDAWTSYTPTVSNWTGGNGTSSGAYILAGKLVHFRVKFVFGSTSTAAGNFAATLPVTAVAARTFAFTAGAYDTSGTAHYGLTSLATSTTGLIVKQVDTNLSATVPFTWATGDEIYVSGTYEAA